MLSLDMRTFLCQLRRGTPNNYFFVYFENDQCFADSSRFAEPITRNERWPWWVINRTILIYMKMVVNDTVTSIC